MKIIEQQGTLYMSSAETTEVLKEHLMKEHDFEVTRAVYQNGGVMVDYVKKERREATESLIRQRRKMNIGIFSALRKFFELEKRKKTKEVKFEELYPIVKAEFRNMKEDLLHLYLYDRRQLPGITYDKVSKIIKL